MLPWIDFQMIVALNDSEDKLTVARRRKLTLIDFELEEQKRQSTAVHRYQSHGVCLPFRRQDQTILEA